MQEYITEFCPHCEEEITLLWDVENDGYQVYCPSCGKAIMLCSMCDRSPCDWTENGCKHSDERYLRNNDGWISVEKALPEEGKKVLTYSKGGEIDVASLYSRDKHMWVVGDMCSVSFGVIAWRLLPRAYEPERSEDVTI